MDHADTTDHELTLSKVEAKLYNPADHDDPRWVYRWMFSVQTALRRRYRTLERLAVEQARKARKEARTAGRFWH